MSSFSVKNCQLDGSGGMGGVTNACNVDDTLAGEQQLTVDCYPMNYTPCQLNSGVNNGRLMHTGRDDDMNEFKGQQSPVRAVNATLSNRGKDAKKQSSLQQQQQQQQQTAALLHLYSHANGSSQNTSSPISSAGASDMHHQMVRSSLHHPVVSNDHIYDMPNRMASQLSCNNSNSLTNSSSIEINDGSIILLNNPSHTIPSHLMQQMTQHSHHLSSHLHPTDSTFSHDTPSDFQFDLAGGAFHLNAPQQQSSNAAASASSSNASGSNHKQISNDLSNRMDFVHIFDCPS